MPSIVRFTSGSGCVKRDALPLPMAPEAPAATGLASGWRRGLPALAATIAVIVVAFASTAVTMIDTWYRSVTYNHGFIVVPIAAWLVWRKRAELAALEPRPAPIVLPLAAALGLVWLAAQYGSVNTLAQFALVGMLVLAVPAVLGIAVARTIMFPLGFLFFAVPAGDFLLPVLMDRTADFTVAALRATGVPVYREGLMLVIPTGRWSIVEACSGIRYLIASLMVGTLFAYLNYRAMWRRLAFVAIAAAVPIVANWVRAYLIVLLGHLSNNRLAVGVDHLVYGWIFFGVVMLLMFSIGARWREPDAGAHAGRTARAATPAIPVRSELTPNPSRFWPAAIAAIAVTLVWPAVDYATQVPTAEAPLALHVGDPAGWRVSTNDTGYRTHYEQPSAELRDSWERGGARAHLEIAYYRQQTPERRLPLGDRPLLGIDDRAWVKTTHGRREVDIDGARLRVLETALHGSNGRDLLVWQWYWAGDAATGDDALVKLRLAWSRLLHRRDDAAAIVVYTEDGEGVGAVDTLQAFTADAWPAIAGALRRAEAP
jgi:exosortase A